MANINDIKKLLQEIINNPASSRLVFNQPRTVSSYDSLVGTSNAMLQAYSQDYGNAILQATAHRRSKILDIMAPGTAPMLNKLLEHSPGVGFGLMGLHGAPQAAQMISNSGFAHAKAFGLSRGGLLDPRQLQQNTLSAVRVGAQAFQKNFNPDGTINLEYSRGLSLPQLTTLQTEIQSDKSHYKAWAKEQLSKKQEDRFQKMTDSEIINFSKGTGETNKTVTSFVDYMHKFQKEMNAFVSSVSKATGSFESAIDFLQRTTNGKAFSAGADADKLRKRADTIVKNMRIFAADAHMNTADLMHLAFNKNNGFSTAFHAGRGTGPISSQFGPGGATSSIGLISAGAFAKWSAANPNAPLAAREKMMASLQNRAGLLGQGNSSDVSSLLAWAVDSGHIDKKEAQRRVKSGNIESVVDLLADNLGGRSQVRNLLSNKAHLATIKEQHADTANDFNALFMESGFTNENIHKGAQNRINEGLSLAKALVLQQAKGDKKARAEISRGFKNLYKNAAFSETAIANAGLDSHVANELAEEARANKWSSARLRREITNRGGDLRLYDVAVLKDIQNSDLISGNKGAAAAMERVRQDLYGAEITEEDRINHFEKEIVQEQKKESQELRHAFNTSKGDKKKRAEALRNIREFADKAKHGKGGYSITGSAFAEYMIDKALQQHQGKALANEDLIAAGAKKIFNDAIASGEKTGGEAFRDVQKYLLTAGVSAHGANVFSTGYDKAFDRYTTSAAEESLLRYALEAGGATEEVSKKRVADYMGYSNLKKEMLDDSAKKRLKKEGINWDDLSAEDQAKQRIEQFLIKQVKENRSSARDKYRRAIEHLGTADAQAVIEQGVVRATFDAVEGNKSNIKREAQKRRRKASDSEIDDQITKDRSSSAERYAGAANTEEARYLHGLLHSGSAFVKDTWDELHNAYGAGIVTATDNQSAKAENRTGGRFTQEHYNAVKRKLNKHGALDNIRKLDSDRIRNSLSDPVAKRIIDTDSDGKLSDDEIRSNISTFLARNKGLSDSELKSKFSETYAGMHGLTIKDNEGKELDFRATLAAYVKSTGLSGKAREQALVSGYTDQRLLDDPALARSTQQQTLLVDLQRNASDIYNLLNDYLPKQGTEIQRGNI